MAVPGVIIPLKRSQLRGDGVFRAEASVGHHLLPDPHVHVSAAAGEFSLSGQSADCAGCGSPRAQCRCKGLTQTRSVFNWRWDYGHLEGVGHLRVWYILGIMLRCCTHAHLFASQMT